MYFNDDTMVVVELETVIDNLPLSVMVLDCDRRIVIANRETRKFTGHQNADLSGIKLGMAYFCKSSMQKKPGCGYGIGCNNCFIRKQIFDTFEYRHKKKVAEGQFDSAKFGLLDLRVTTSYLKSQDYTLVSIENITPYKALERDLMEKNKLQAALETAGAICHEMNQPLQVISGYIDLILSTEIKEMTVNDYLNITREQINRLVGIVGKLRNLKRYRTSEYTPGSDILDIATSSQE